MPLTGPWRLRDEADAARLLAGYPGQWWVVGGRAIEAFTGISWPTDFLQIWLRREATQPWEFDVLFEPGDPGQWINRRLPEMVRPLDEVTWAGGNGVRYQTPRSCCSSRRAMATEGMRLTSQIRCRC